MICRILSHSSPDARMNEAIEEALLLTRHEGQPLDTIHVWQNGKTAILASNADVRTSIDEEACKSSEVAIVRRATLIGKTTYQDEGTLNLTYVIDQKQFFPDTDSLTEAYRGLWRPVVDVMSSLGVAVEVPDYGEPLVVGDRTIAEVWVRFYYDLMFFQLSINVQTDLKAQSRALRQGARLTTLSREVNRMVSINDIQRALIEGIAERFEVTFQEEETPSPVEKKLAERLHEIKYSRHDWNFEAKAPLSIKDVLIEVYVAYPPTRSCREIIEAIQSAMCDLNENVELRIWMRGKGLDGHGLPAGVPMSIALTEAAKQAIIPAVVVNGELAFSRDVPSAEDVERKILQALER
jgi:lipoate-protein ligase A